MSVHTLAEWQRDGMTVFALNLEGTNRFWARVDGGWSTACRVRTDESELIANARLIAAAPKLLAFARAFVENIDEWDGEPAPGQRWHKEYVAAKALISEATGEKA